MAGCTFGKEEIGNIGTCDEEDETDRSEQQPEILNALPGQKEMCIRDRVVRIGPDGAVYAATIPDGKVYRIKAGGSTSLDETTAEIVFDLSKPEGNKDDAQACLLYTSRCV